MPLTGNLLQARRDSLAFLLDARARYGDVVRLRLGPLVLHMVSSPEGAKQILKTAHGVYLRTTPTNARLRDIIGDSLLTTDGCPWQARRKAIAPTLAPAPSLAMTPIVGRLAENVTKRWAAADSSVAVNSDMMELTLAIITEVLFGVPIGDEAARMERALSDVLLHHWRRVQSPFDLPHRLPTRSRRAFTAGTTELRNILARLQAQADPGRTASMLARLGGLNADDELLTLLLAGHETTANALSWALWLLATHPDEQDRLRSEAQIILGNRAPTANDLPKLVHATRVFEETMRLYPPIWLLDRQATEDDEIAGYRIPGGTTVIVAPWVIHRHPDYWKDPDKFKPDRFIRRPVPFTYIPFGAGPHACVGGNLAMVEGPLILATLLRSIRLSVIGRSVPQPFPGLTLRMRQPLRLAVTAA